MAVDYQQNRTKKGFRNCRLLEEGEGGGTYETFSSFIYCELHE